MKWFFAWAILCLMCTHAEAGNQIDYDQFEIYADTADLPFEKLLALESAEEIQFGAFDGMSSSVSIYWIKIDYEDLGNAEYLLFSNFFDRIETYYVGDLTPYSITGKFVEFDDRAYKKGFYRMALSVDKNKKTTYIKLISKTGNSIFSRSLSQIETSSISQIKKQATVIHSVFTLLTGMELIILLINLFLIYLKPSKTGFSYVFFILTGIFLSNLNTQVLVDMAGISVVVLHHMEMIIGVLIIYSFSLFSAYYLNANRYSKGIHHILVFPIFPLIISTSFISNGYYFPLFANTYFLLTLITILWLVIISWKTNPKAGKTFVLANGLSIIAALVMILALRGFLTHHFVTINGLFLGIILRDTIFTFDLIKNYFKLQTGAEIRKAAIVQLTEEKDQLKKIEELKTVFFNNISHELRTPLTLILSPLENSLKSGDISEEVKKELNLSLKNGKYLLQLVNEMLDLSKLDNGELQLLRQPTDVIKSIKKIRETFQPYAKERRQTIFSTHAQESIIAMIDPDKFDKIIINLISNAIKYSNKPGDIVIKIDQKEDTLEIKVIDHGRGISQKELPKIFNRYFQSEEISAEEGTGIGLSIVKEFVELHSGTVLCKSQYGQGTTFTLTFPQSISQVENIDYSGKIDAFDPSKSTILIVEDHVDMREYLREKLFFFNIITAGDGNLAMSHLESGLLPDLILTDYAMPNLNGYEFTLRLMKEPKWAQIPIIFLTARTLSIDKLKVLNLGVNDYIIKPFDFEELIVRIKNILNVGQQRKEFAKSNLPDLSLEKQQTFKAELDTYIFKNLSNSKLSNSNLASKFMLSERNLYRRIKLVTGQPPASYIREIRLQKARMLLESQNDLTIAEVAYETGIDNLAHFSQMFKKRFGKSPRDLAATDNGTDEVLGLDRGRI